MAKKKIKQSAKSKNEAPRGFAARYLRNSPKPSTLLRPACAEASAGRQGFAGFSSPSSPQQDAEYSAKENKKRKIVVAVSGGFDPIHVGHVRLFRKAKKFGDELVVILNNDNWLQKKKGFMFSPQEYPAYKGRDELRPVENINPAHSTIRYVLGELPLN